MDKVPKGWEAFAEHAKQRAPDEDLQEASGLVREKGAALDMGAGALNETEYLLKIGFKRVVALDAQQGILERAKGLGGGEHLEVVVSRFEDYAFSSNTFGRYPQVFSFRFPKYS